MAANNADMKNLNREINNLNTMINKANNQVANAPPPPTGNNRGANANANNVINNVNPIAVNTNNMGNNNRGNTNNANNSGNKWWILYVIGFVVAVLLVTPGILFTWFPETDDDAFHAVSWTPMDVSNVGFMSLLPLIVMTTVLVVLYYTRN